LVAGDCDVSCPDLRWAVPAVTQYLLLYLNSQCVAWWCNGYGVGLRLERSRVQLLAVLLTGKDLEQVVHTHVPLSAGSVIWYQSWGSDVLRLGR